MNLSLITLFPLMHNKGRLPQEALFAQIKQAGFQAVDLCGYDFASLTEAEVRSALQRLGLKAACYIDFVPSPAMGDAEAGARVKSHIRKGLERTEALGAAVYMFAPSGYADAIRGVPRRDVADALAEDLAYTVQLAAPKGISVVIEDAPDITFPMCSAEEVLYLLRKVPGLRHVFDTGNMLAAGIDQISIPLPSSPTSAL